MRNKLVSAIVALTVALLGIGAHAALAAPGNDHKVTLCHATASTTNPYVQITVDIASVKSFNHFKTEGHGSHTGPVFNPNGGKNQPAWGDIIPAFTFTFDHGPDTGKTVSYSGMNLSAAGRAILANGCDIPVTPPGGRVTASVTPPSCDEPSFTVRITNTTDADVTVTVLVNRSSIDETVGANETLVATVGVDPTQDNSVAVTFGEKVLASGDAVGLDCGNTTPPPGGNPGNSGNSVVTTLAATL